MKHGDLPFSKPEIMWLIFSDPLIFTQYLLLQNKILILPKALDQSAQFILLVTHIRHLIS